MRAAVLGHPVAHSLSPVLHAAAHAALGLRGWTYTAHDVDADRLAPFLAGLQAGWAGLSLTMPLKQVVVPLLADVSPLARQVGAVNTVLPLAASSPGLGWRGENTDVHGVVAALGEAGVQRATTASVLGGGATATSALAALARLGVREPVVHVRSPARAAALADVAARLGVQPRVKPWERVQEVARDVLAAEVVVSTVPAGATDALAAALAAPAAPAAPPASPAPGAPRPRGVLLDVVYAPWPTPLAQVWAARGGTVVGGLAMLLHQAGEQVRLMTGHAPPLGDMRRAGEAELAARSSR